MSWYILRAAILVPICLPLCTQAHMQMSSPYPLRSALDPAVPEQYKDYSMTSPLLSDGSNFPCKHYQYNDTNPQAYDIKATYEAGSNYSLNLAGSATHSGGSCQISLSYDNGATFKVIQSIIGGCPLILPLPFTVPSFAPSSSSVLLSWSWFNVVGNREMYQNCARVQVNGAPSQRYRRTTYDRRQTSLDQLPDMFACNVGNGCRTIENSEVVFPNPGANVIYGQDAVTPQPGPGFVITGSNSTSTSTTMASTTFSLPTTSPAPFPTFNTSTFGPTGTGYPNYTTTALTTSSSSMSLTSMSSIPTSTTQVFGPVTITITITVTPTPVGSVTPSPTLSTTVITIATTSTTLVARDTTTPTLSGTTFTTIFVTPTLASSSSTPSPSSLSLPCNPGTFSCNSPSTFSQCSDSGASYIYMGSVAAGMQCVNGQIIRQNAGSCTPNGQIFCNGSTAFYVCDQGGLIPMGPVAPGTVCRNGAIVAA